MIYYIIVLLYYYVLYITIYKDYIRYINYIPQYILYILYILFNISLQYYTKEGKRFNIYLSIYFFNTGVYQGIAPNPFPPLYIWIITLCTEVAYSNLIKSNPKVLNVYNSLELDENN